MEGSGNFRYERCSPILFFHMKTPHRFILNKTRKWDFTNLFANLANSAQIDLVPVTMDVNLQRHKAVFGLPMQSNGH